MSISNHNLRQILWYSPLYISLIFRLNLIVILFKCSATFFLLSLSRNSPRVCFSANPRRTLKKNIVTEHLVTSHFKCEMNFFFVSIFLFLFPYVRIKTVYLFNCNCIIVQYHEYSLACRLSILSTHFLSQPGPSHGSKRLKKEHQHVHDPVKGIMNKSSVCRTLVHMCPKSEGALLMSPSTCIFAPSETIATVRRAWGEKTQLTFSWNVSNGFQSKNKLFK